MAFDLLACCMQVCCLFSIAVSVAILLSNAR